MRQSPKRTEVAIMRCAAKIEQKQLARLCDVSQSYLQKVELGKLPVSRPLLQKIKAHCA